MYRLLIADDEMVERQAIQYVIDHNFPDFFETREACNGREALKTASEFKPDIIFFDIKMPGINGLEAATKIREFLPECRIILMSAYSYFNYVQEALNLGADDYITKPAPVSEVVAVLKKVITSLNENGFKKKKEKENSYKLKVVTECLEEELLSMITGGNISESTINNYFELLDIKFKMCICAIFQMSTDIAAENGTISKNKILASIREKINGNSYKSFIAFIKGGIYLIIFADYDVNENAFIIRGGKLLEEIREDIKKMVCRNVNMSIGNICRHVNDMYKSFQQAKTSFNSNGMPGIANQNEENDATLRRTNKLIQNVMDYIEKNYNKDITLEDTAEKIKMSSFYLSKFFKQESGENFIDYVTSVRIKKAKEFLSDPLNNVKDVSYMVGYNDPNYFTRVFKKRCGITPTEYRNKNLYNSNSI